MISALNSPLEGFSRRGSVTPLSSSQSAAAAAAAAASDQAPAVRCVYARFRVIDTGPGLSAKAIRLMQRSAKAGERMWEALEDVKGAGLRVTRAIVNEMGGRMAITSAHVRCGVVNSLSVCFEVVVLLSPFISCTRSL